MQCPWEGATAVRRCPHTNRAPSPRLWSLSCLPTSVVAPCQLAPVCYRCAVSSPNQLCAGLLDHEHSEPSFVGGLSQPPSILTCLPLWVRQPTIADFPRSLLQDKQTKATYVVLLRGTLPGFLPNSPRPPFRVKCAIDCEPYGARSFLKLVMGSQHLSSSTLTSRFGSQTSTCTTSDH